MKRRTVEAQATAEVYLFVAEFLQLVSDSHVFQVCDIFSAVAGRFFIPSIFFIMLLVEWWEDIWFVESPSVAVSKLLV